MHQPMANVYMDKTCDHVNYVTYCIYNSTKFWQSKTLINSQIVEDESLLTSFVDKSLANLSTSSNRCIIL